MRIGIITNTYFPNLNGVSIAVQSLEKSLIKAGHKVFIATPRINGIEYADNIFPIQSVAVPKHFSSDLHMPYLYQSKLAQWFKEKQIDIIHTQDIALGAVEGVMIANKLGVPCIHTYHTDVESYSYWSFPGQKQFFRNWITSVCNGHDRIITVSDKMTKYLLKRGVTTNISQTINIPYLDNITPLAQPDLGLAKKLGIKSKDIVVITFGRIAPEKGIDLGLDVIIPSLKKHKNLKYILAGTGVESYLDQLRQKIQAANATDQVIFSGSFDQSSLPHLASISDIYLNTSTTENQPTTVLESMWLSLSDIIIKDDAFNYILEHEYNALSGSAQELGIYLEDLIEHPEKRTFLSKNARKSALVIKKRNVVQEYIDIYESVITEYKERQESIKNNKSPLQKRIVSFRSLIRTQLTKTSDVVESFFSS